MANKLAPEVAPKKGIILMAILLSPLSGTSEVRNQFLKPLRAVYDQATTWRKCPAESDWDWLTKGVERVLSNVRSGRDFLQTFQMFWPRELQVGPYFEALARAQAGHGGGMFRVAAAAGGGVPAIAPCPV